MLSKCGSTVNYGEFKVSNTGVLNKMAKDYEILYTIKKEILENLDPISIKV